MTSLAFYENIQDRFSALMRCEDTSKFDDLDITLQDIENSLTGVAFTQKGYLVNPRIKELSFEYIFTGNFYCHLETAIDDKYSESFGFYFEVPDDIKSLDDPLPVSTQIQVIKEVFYSSLHSIGKYTPLKDFLYHIL